MNQLAERLGHIIVMRARLEQIHRLNPHVGIEPLIVADHVEQQLLHAIVGNAAMHQHRALRIQLNFDLRRRVASVGNEIDAGDICGTEILIAERNDRCLTDRPRRAVCASGGPGAGGSYLVAEP